MYGLIAIPVVALGAAYGLGAFSTNISSINEKISPEYRSSAFAKDPKALEKAVNYEKTAFRGDSFSEQEPYQASAGRKRKTKKTKSKNKKTKRRR